GPCESMIHGMFTGSTISNKNNIVSTKNCNSHWITGVKQLNTESSYTHKNVKVIIVSGLYDIGVAKEAINLGAVDYVTKPVSFDYLREMLKKYEKEIFG
ncbi:hypothetical protein K8I28_05525, partial [bacterium]|nr:hypothetical protein [bacterium]